MLLTTGKKPQPKLVEANVVDGSVDNVVANKHKDVSSKSDKKD